MRRASGEGRVLTVVHEFFNRTASVRWENCAPARKQFSSRANTTHARRPRVRSPATLACPFQVYNIGASPIITFVQTTSIDRFNAGNDEFQ